MVVTLVIHQQMKQHLATFLTTLLLYQFSYAQDNQVESNIEIEIFVKNGEFRPSTDENLVHVMIRNLEDSSIYICDTKSANGYYSISFEIETKDSIYNISKIRKVWLRGVPSGVNILPNESVTLTFNLINSTYQKLDAKYSLWKGLPNRKYETAKISVTYEFPNEERIALQLRRNYRELNYKDAVVGDFKPSFNTDSYSRLSQDSLITIRKPIVSKQISIQIY